MMLELDKLTAAYGQAIALENLSLQIGKGELVAILGPNGAGKSTLLKVISRALPSRGTLNFNGQSLHQYSTEQVVGQGICHCPEGRRLFPELSVIKNLQLGAYLRHDRDAVARDLERVYALFPILAERRLLDEPSVGIAHRLKMEIFAAIRKICDAGVAILVAEQDAQSALHIADRAYVLEHGSVAQEGTAKALSSDDRIRKIYLGVA
jgi:branched-chain amino acid transport system ATP-binding protein